MERFQARRCRQTSDGPEIGPEQMGAAVAVRATETPVHRFHPAFHGHMCQIAFGYRIRIGFHGLHRIGRQGQAVYVPAYLLLTGEVPGHTLVQTTHGTAYITVCARLEMCFTQGTDIENPVRTQGDEEHVCAPAHGHCLLLSSSSTWERVFMRMMMLLSSILDGEMLATSPSLRPYTMTFSRYS